MVFVIILVRTDSPKPCAIFCDWYHMLISTLLSREIIELHQNMFNNSSTTGTSRKIFSVHFLFWIDIYINEKLFQVQYNFSFTSTYNR